ncbi:microtubule organization protein AKNA isoform X4 [Takifugu flavidus]|uniref:microtubule organization protein AKNA isoform X4 n=1 Tax=Takifugu flavidus TaxID=433684 RepID=UPI002544B820|nr:microtubule organization protein AKNA isoform X4 [Takifugu flavidus]
METKRSSGEEEFVLTPASSHTSCEGGCSQSDDHDDFVGLMDENGIIGLLEALEIVGVGEYSDDGESCHKVPSGLPAPVETETRLDEMGHDRSGSLPRRKSPAEDVQILTQSPGLNSEAEMTGDKKNKGVMRRTDRKQNRSKHTHPSGMLTQATGVAKERSRIFQRVSPATATCAREEIPAPLGIDAETFLDLSFTEGLEETHRSLPNLRPGPCFPPSAAFPGETVSGVANMLVNGSKFPDGNRQPPTPSSRTMDEGCPDAARSSASFTTEASKNTSSRADRNPTASRKSAMLKNPSKSRPNGSTPDYSNVKPRVNFPKVLYKPPKSRLCSQRESLSTGPPTGCDSSAGGGKEVGPNMPGVPSATECQELGCPKEATRLLSELEENYNKLWIRYAEAENTIDHLRLAAKVNLHSDGPKPGHLLQSIYNQEASKFMMLNFPQAQRAETSSVSLHSNGHRTPEYTPRDPPDSPVTKEPDRILCSQANEFLHQFYFQLQTFEDLLNCRKLKPDEQRKELSQLFEGLRSLESSFLLAKDEHKLLKKEEENSHFDPDRELEGLIFDCVLYMEELREHAEQITEDLLTFEPSPTLARSPSLSEAKEYLTDPQKTHIPSVVEPQQAAAAAAAMFSSISNKRDREEAQKETLHLRTVDGKAGHNGEFNKPPDNSHQSIREIPQPLALSQKNEAHLPPASKPDMQPVELEEEESNQSFEKLKVKERPQQSPQDSSPHSYSGAQPVSQPIMLDPSSRQGCEMKTSHSSSLSSLGETAALEKKNSKLQSGSCRMPSQDGIFSPETDSGFNGTESRHPTPTGVPSLLHQGAIESSSVVRNRDSKNPDSGVVTSPHPYSLLPSCCPATELRATSKFNSKQPRRTKPRKGQRRRTFTCSHQSWLKKSESEMSDVEPSSSSVSEAGRIGRYAESVTPVSATSSRSSQHCHGSCPKARSFPELPNNSVSMQMLQAEVSRLHTRLESCLKERGQSVSSSATMVQENHHHPRTSTPRVSRAVNTDGGAAVRKRPCCGQRHSPDVLGCSDDPHTPPQSVVSRCTQTLSAASYTNTVHRKKDPSRTAESTIGITHRSVSVQAPEASDEPDTTHPRPAHHQAPCRHCISYQRAQAEVPAASSKESVRSCCGRHCRHCGSTDTDCPRFTHSNTNTHHQPAEAVKCCTSASAAPPSSLQYLCPLPVLLCPSPSCPSPSNNNDTIAGVRSQKAARKFAAPPGGRNFLDRSLNKAIRAAKHMKSTSGHMSHSLRFGLHQQQQLLTPLMSQLSQRQTSN